MSANPNYLKEQEINFKRLLRRCEDMVEDGNRIDELGEKRLSKVIYT